MRRRLLLRVVAAMLVLYLGGAGFIWWSMHQPPEVFGRVIKKMPGVVFLLFPFETMWTQARAGTLKVGDPAPDFSLIKQDKSGSVQLSALNRQRPVVLIFGSYT